jgi:hypothetical protein
MVRLGRLGRGDYGRAGGGFLGGRPVFYVLPVRSMAWTISERFWNSQVSLKQKLQHVVVF